MSCFDTFHCLSALLSFIEKVAFTQPGHRVRSLTFHDGNGKTVGALVLDGTMVCAGVQVDSSPYIDEPFCKDTAQYAPALRKFLSRESLTPADSKLLSYMPLRIRSALRALTARALLKLAALYDPTQLELSQRGLGKLPEVPSAQLGYSFHPVELMLAAGRQGEIDYTDLAAQLYETLHEHTIERWLFEWQSAASAYPFPVMTTRLAERTVDILVRFGELGHSLSQAMAPSRRREERKNVCALAAQTDEHVYLMVGTARYLVLLVYPVARSGKVQELIEELAATDGSAELPKPTPPPPHLPAVPASIAVHDQAHLPGDSAAKARRESAAAPIVAAPAPTPNVIPAAHPPPILSLRDFGLQIGASVILAEIDFEIPARGSYLVVVPSSGEKRLLLRVLSLPWPKSFKLFGKAFYLGSELGARGWPAIPQSSAELLMLKTADYLVSSLPQRMRLPRAELLSQAAELVRAAGFPELIASFDQPMYSIECIGRRVLEVVRAVAASPELLLLDEPLSGLTAQEQPRLLQLLRKQAAARAVLILTSDPAPFVGLAHPAGRLIDGRMLASSVPAEQAVKVGRGQGPQGVQWLRRGVLAGIDAPGATRDIDSELERIRHAGVSRLVSLVDPPLPDRLLHEHGLKGLFFPIPDRQVPNLEATAELCACVENLISQGEVVGFHCEAGSLRIGTMLAAQLIWEGTDASTALGLVRAMDARWIQPEQQTQFLFKYEEWLRKHQPFLSNKQKRSAVHDGT